MGFLTRANRNDDIKTDSMCRYDRCQQPATLGWRYCKYHTVLVKILNAIRDQSAEYTCAIKIELNGLGYVEVYASDAESVWQSIYLSGNSLVSLNEEEFNTLCHDLDQEIDLRRKLVANTKIQEAIKLKTHIIMKPGELK